MTFSWQPLARVLFEGDAHVMEDACGFRGPHAWVIDGASQLLEPIGMPAASDPQWLAQQLSIELALLAGTPVEEDDAGARQLLARSLDAIDVIAQKLAGDEHQRFPSAAISVASLRGTTVEIAGLADCTVVVKTASGEIHEIQAELADARVDLVAARRSVDPAERRQLLIRDRQLRNTEGNLWVARREAEAAQHAHVAVIENPVQISMASDGAWRAVELGLVSGAAEFLEQTSTTARALELMTELRRHQGSIGEVSDDACVLSLAVARS